jgi:hypothetical protein
MSNHGILNINRGEEIMLFKNVPSEINFSPNTMNNFNNEKSIAIPK